MRVHFNFKFLFPQDFSRPFTFMNKVFPQLNKKFQNQFPFGFNFIVKYTIHFLQIIFVPSTQKKFT